MHQSILALVTASSREQARLIATTLVDERLAACVNLVDAITSIYRWQGSVQEEQEVLLLIKTRRELFDRLEARIRALHSYDIPEIIALPIAHGSHPYLAWLAAETSGDLPSDGSQS